MGALMRAHDWSDFPLGPPAGWPEGLKIPLRMMLSSRFEMWLGWGPDLNFFYNDAYRPTLGIKHPAALGRPVRQVWAEIYDAVRERFDSVMRDGVPTWDEALLLLLERRGYPEETYHTFSYSPLYGGTGAVEGLMCVVSEETERVVSERRLGTLSTLAGGLIGLRSRDAVAAAALKALGENRRDFPFSLIYLFDAAKTVTGAYAPADVQALLPVFQDQAASLARPMRVALSGNDLPCGDWSIPPREMLLVPIAKAGQGRPLGVLALGLNPYRPGDADIEGFAGLVAGQLAGAFAEIEARDSERSEIARLQEMFAQSPSFTAILRGPQHRFELTNPAYMQLIGHRDVIGKPVREALPEVEEQGFPALLDNVFRTGETFVGRSMTVLLVRTPGAPPEPRILDFVFQPMRDAAGSVSGIFVEGIDITSAHEADAARQESEAQFRTFAQAMPNHVWAATPDGQLDWFNEQTLAYSGLRPEDLVGDRWAGIVHPGDLEAAAAAWADALGKGRDYETEFRIRRADGVYRWHLVRSLPIRDAQGAIIRWVGTNTDIQDQKEVAAALEDINTTLEQRVQERTGQLQQTEEALRQAQKMEAVGQLTGGIAHDFNNLLQGITGALDRVQHRIAEGRVKEVDRFLKAAVDSANRAAALTHRLLAFSRRQTLDPRALDPNRLIAGMEDLIRRTMGPTVQVEVVGAGGLWPIRADGSQLENSLLNLCINARDAMPDGGRLTIETANKWLDARAAKDRELPPGQYVSLCVTDSGTGMAPEVIARAFDPFFTTKPLGQGTGLGLSMIYGFVRQSGGQVRIYSEEGKGTTMCLYFPRHLGTVEDEVSEASQIMERGFGETVLVVDDEPTVRMLIAEVLSESYYRILEAGDGLAALKILETGQRIDLLITDVGLPGGMNGRQVADAARVLRGELKVLFITGYAENAAVGNGHLDPGMEILAKPFAMSTLANKVREMIER
ncbi:MAG: hybrid sensor histidine kinase/response regulator [Mucilaginibacter sp.]|nr:hybrid sensor histidine kinase/response regulator [Mucilaginibacter sp.]